MSGGGGSLGGPGGSPSTCFDDLRVGDQFSTHGRTLTAADMVNFAGVTGDINPLHMDEEYASQR